MVVYEPLPKLRDGKPLMAYIRQAQYKKLDPTGEKLKMIERSNPERLRAGDVVSVFYKNQKPVIGAILMVKRSGVASAILLRNKVAGLGVEVNVPIFNPNVMRIDILRRPDTYRSRNRHYYIRNSRLDVKEVKL
ncbi:hypothetical protein OGAPHI_002615 [Ogataea philodendri]|uniref:Uncharacterized protein n=1 Tax=Ogataea philodendri TaxID=1378263 RepID=A0A9P8PC47_9ASCO|nr:uncharacterized protein OGAPHI_002615 [Ogataea philodendri]KAH3668860.1 hypothetical protein OGAPHI_002615 [Ogataea philodendri]